MKKEFAETDWLLQQWGRWSRVNSAPSLKLPTMTSVRKLLGSTLPSPVIDDESAMKVDSTVARLIERDSEAGQAIVVFYCSTNSVASAARMLRISRFKAQNLIYAGTAWLDSALEQKY